jgi:hypothetical protein
VRAQTIVEMTLVDLDAFALVVDAKGFAHR